MPITGVGQPNGVATLDGTSKVPLAQLPQGAGSGMNADTVQSVDVVSLTANYNVSKSNPDANGKYTTVTYTRTATGKVYMVSTLSNGPDTNGNYTTMTNVFYKADGTTVDHTETWTITYDANGFESGRTVAYS